MADVRLSRGGTATINYAQCAGTPQTFGPPYGQKALPGSPPYNAHADGVLFPILSMPVRPRVLEVQRNNIMAAEPAVGDGYFLVYLPTNHSAKSLRFDVHVPDPILVGATVIPTAWLEQWDPATKTFITQEMPDVTAAAAAQGVVPIPVDVPSSTMVRLERVVAGYAMPIYLPPLLHTFTDAHGHVHHHWHEIGAIHFGVKIITMPTDPAITLDRMQGDWYFSVVVEKFECMTTV